MDAMSPVAFECVLVIETHLNVAPEDARNFGMIVDVGDGREVVALVPPPKRVPAGSTPAAVVSCQA